MGRRIKNLLRKWKAKVGWKTSNKWRDVLRGWHGAGLLGLLFYVALGVGLAFAAEQAMVFALSSEMPAVAVLSQSMQHDDAQGTYYGWLYNHFGYTEDQVDKWPVTGGFLMGDMPIIQGADEYEVGDVIVYSISCEDYPGHCEVPIIHRIIKVNSDGTYQTKGDNNPSQFVYELSVSKDQIYGKVVVVVPKLGYFKVMLTRALGLV